MVLRKRSIAPSQTQEHSRVIEAEERRVYWRRWGPYLAERAWGTVREDYSNDGEAWAYFPHDHARSRAYRWNEDGIAGISDRRQRICFALAFWNGKDTILKERIFGLDGVEGNHGEDPKEYYFYAENTPTHSYMRYAYKYPQAAFPYAELVTANRGRSKRETEFEIGDTKVFDEQRYFDISIEYAKAGSEDIVVRVTAHNRGPESARLHVLPTVWFRNTWSWFLKAEKPSLHRLRPGEATLLLEEPYYGERYVFAEGKPTLLVTENETNTERIFHTPNASPYVKDAFHARVVDGNQNATNPIEQGTKAAFWYNFELPAGGSKSIYLRISDKDLGDAWIEDLASVLELRKAEAAEFYQEAIPKRLTHEAKHLLRQVYSGMLWNKQFYHYVVEQWLNGDPSEPVPPFERIHGRNAGWRHLHNDDVVFMPDKWEYPWYAAWDTAFHCVTLALIDPAQAKEQLILLLREWYMHPNGQIPAYEWALGDTNPPVHAWAALQVYRVEKRRWGRADRKFLQRIFHKLLINFTWWVNRKDVDGNNLFEGGFLGLDNIGVFDRSKPLPMGGRLEQSDSTGWMAMYALDMFSMALELAVVDSSYEDIASKFWEHFIHIAHAMNDRGGEGVTMWNEEDGFFYDVLRLEHEVVPLKIRSLVGLIPLLAVAAPLPDQLSALTGFVQRRDWFLENRPDLTAFLGSMMLPGMGQRRLLAMVTPERLRRIAEVLFDEEEFLSPYGIRSLSKVHAKAPYVFDIQGTEHRVDYEPGESQTYLFGGNSNWRGPIWFPLNYMLIRALLTFHEFLGDDFRVECPTRSGNWLTLSQAAEEVARRLVKLFLSDAQGQRPCHGRDARFSQDPHFREFTQFHEYFHADTGEGLGAGHQTGWTALLANLFDDFDDLIEAPTRRSRAPRSQRPPA